MEYFNLNVNNAGNLNFTVKANFLEEQSSFILGYEVISDSYVPYW